MSYTAQEVLLTEHLTFPPLSLIDEIINTANSLIYKCINALEKLFDNLSPESIPGEEIESGIHQFETLLENAVDQNFDKLELYVLRNIVNIPDNLIGWVQLKHHAGLDFNTEDSAEVDEELIKARKTYAASLKVKSMLAKERAINAKKLATLDVHENQLAFLEERARTHDVGSLKDTAGYLSEQVASIRRQIEELSQLSACLDGELKPNKGSTSDDYKLAQIVKGGSWEKELAEASEIGKVEDIQKAVNALQTEP